jgi:hypothetical protein
MDSGILTIDSVVLLTYFIVAFMIGSYGKQVYNNCPMGEDKLKEVGGGKSTAIASITMNSFSMILLLACYFNLKFPNTGPFDVISKNVNGNMLGKALGYGTVLLLGLSLSITVISEFESVKTASLCDVTVPTTKAEIDAFRSAADNLNRMYGIVVMFILAGIYSGVLIFKEIFM